MPRRVSTVGTYRGDATLDFGGRQVQVVVDLANGSGGVVHVARSGALVGMGPPPFC